MSSETEATQAPGAFMASLVRNNKTIRDDRAASIGEDAEMVYKRKVEDLRMQLRRKVRDRDNMLDLSPSDKNTLMVASDFQAQVWADKDHSLGVEIRTLSIELEIAEQRYATLFSGTVKEEV